MQCETVSIVYRPAKARDNAPVKKKTQMSVQVRMLVSVSVVY